MLWNLGSHEGQPVLYICRQMSVKSQAAPEALSARICWSTYASFNLLPTQKAAIYTHMQANTTTAGSLASCVVCGAAWVRKHPANTQAVSSQQRWPQLQSLLLASDQNAKLPPGTHFLCVLEFQSFQKFLSNTDESLRTLLTEDSESSHTSKGSCHIKSPIRACGPSEK